MALGEPIGYAMWLSQNNGAGGLYPPHNMGSQGVHVALLGDPTLRMHPVKPPGPLAAVSSDGIVSLRWTASADSNIEGYHIYRSVKPGGPFQRLTLEPVSATTYTDAPLFRTNTYLVRAIKTEQSASGTYLNPSSGVFAQVIVNGDQPFVNLRIIGAGQSTIIVEVTGPSPGRFRIQTSSDLKTWTDAVDAHSAAITEVPVNAAGTRSVFLRAVELR